MLVFSLLFFAASAWLIVDLFALGGRYYAMLPDFLATAFSLLGLILAAIKIRINPKKKRAFPRVVALMNVFACILATLLWILRLTGRLDLLNIV